MSKKDVAEGVREYNEQGSVKIYFEKEEGAGKDRWIIKAYNEGGYCVTLVDLEDLLEYVKNNMAFLLK